MKVLNLDGLTHYNKSLLNKVETMINEKVNTSNGTTFGTAIATSSRSDNVGYYTKIATIDVSSGAWSTCTGVFNVTDSENSLFNGQFIFYFRSQSNINETEVTLHWISLTNYTFAECIAAVKVSDGIFDLYYKPPITYLSTNFTLIDCINAEKITLYSNQDYVESLEADYTSNLTNIASTASTLNGLTSAVYELNYCDGVTSNIQDQLNNKSDSSHTHNYIPMTGSKDITGILRTHGEIQSTTPNAFRLAYGNHGTILRNDGAATYFLLTNENDNFGDWNDLRPFTINNATGVVSFANGIEGSLNGNATSASNADTVDGCHAESFPFVYSNYGANYFNSTDLNTWIRPGEYAIQSGCTNTPTERGEDVWGTIFIVKGLADRISQYAVFWNEDGNPLWHRCLNGSTWSTWLRVRDGGNASHANSSISSAYTDALSSTGFGDTNFTYYQTGDTFYDNSGWCHYLISNHGSGESYYNYVIGLPFWSSPIYRRQDGSSSNRSDWHKFYTTENITYGTNSLTPGSSSLSTGSIYLQYE